MPAFAHSPRGGSAASPEPLADHLSAVGARAEGFGAAFGWGGLAEIAGRLHDIGKCSAEFQAYLLGTRASGGDHSGAGAIEARKLGLPSQLGHALAAVIAGHHAGLADGGDLADRLGRGVPAYPDWLTHSGALPAPAALAPTRKLERSPETGFNGVFLIRMLFSCLVDADSIETARFYGEAERTPFLPIERLRDRLDAHLDTLAGAAPPTALNALRAEVLAHARSRAELPPGLFTLTVPTGGGKTLASLSFALRHAAQHGLRRVVTVIPFAGAWIETSSGPPCSKRGSSLPRGSVDRNQSIAKKLRGRVCRSLAGAWIETPSGPPRSSCPSSLPRGGVDRNDTYPLNADETNGRSLAGGVDRNCTLKLVFTEAR